MAAVGQTENLTELENLNEQTLLLELQARYNRDVIYTYVGEILVAVNPFKAIDGIYSGQKSIEYTNLTDRSIKAPHIFATADAAFASMANNPAGKLANQVCVISGESGAGKTESAKLFIKHIIYLSTRLGITNAENAKDVETAKGLEEKIIQLNPMLEAFGNAQTLMNDNSSRFGKFIELRFSQELHVQGVLMYEYLLEKSRVVQQGPGEQNFHIFYLYFSGLPQDLKNKFQISNPENHRFIRDNPTALAKINSKLYKDMWEEVVQCMGIVGFTQAEVNDLWALLAGVIHAGDIEFSGEDQAAVSSAKALERTCSALGVDMDAMGEALTTSVNVMRGENVVRAYKLYEAEDARDAMAKGLYGRAFTFIVRKANELLGPQEKKLRPGEKTIGILDIFGFECFKRNSFEQLLINLANEQLQFFFNNHIFKMELDEYAREGIDGSKITYEDNQPLLDLLLQKPRGLLAICDEEAFFPKASDDSMIEKMHAALVELKGYERPRGNECRFTIHHYAGKVDYDGDGFLEKNRDSLAVDVVGCLRMSENDLVRALFGADSADNLSAKKSAKSIKTKNAAEAKKKLRQSVKKVAKEQAKTKKTTVGSEFKESLAELMKEMSDASPHFIRCIKPNMEKKAGNFNGELVTKQLRYTGMLETTRIRKEGYASRPLFADFVSRYKLLGFSFGSNPAGNVASCEKILKHSGIQGYQIGATKVFLRYFHVDQLNEAMRPFPRAATFISKVCRGFTARRRVRKALQQSQEQKKMVDALCLLVEKKSAEMETVMQSLIEEDEIRPLEAFSPKYLKEKQAQQKEFNKFQKSIKKHIKKEGFTREASVRWFKEVEMKKGAGMSGGGGFQEWFHGIITRAEAEELLKGNEPGTFLVRVAESRFGYSLSHVVHENDRVKHYMIDQTPDGQYQVVGNKRLFPSLNALVEHHKKHRVVSTDPVPLIYACGQTGPDDLAEFKAGEGKKKK